MICFICQKRHANANGLIKHFKLVHGLCSGKGLKLKCAHRGCSHVYYSCSGLRKHLSKCYANYNFCADDGECSTSTNSISLGEADMPELPDQSVPSESVLLERHIVNSCAKLVAELKLVGNSEKTINFVVSTVQEVIRDLDHLKHENLKSSLVLEEPIKSVVESQIDLCFENTLYPFLPLNTESKRTIYFSEKWGKIDPVEYVLGTRFATRFNRTTGTFGQSIVKDKFVYIPILETLKSIYQHPNMKDMITRDPKQRENFLYDIQDGEFFKNPELFSKQEHTVQIQLFFDEFECANPIGSKRGIHKVGAIYFTLRNVSPKYNSSLQNIHLVSLFHAEDIKTYGFGKILAPLVQDILTLETSGIQLSLFDHTVYGSIIQVTGDNLGLHSLFGFVESFSARYYCRFCLLEKEDFQTVFSEDGPKISVRTKQLHAEHCQEMQINPSLPYVMGVKKSCPLNLLQYFHTSTNFSVDIMHDILEGVAQYEMKLLFQHLIENYTTSAEVHRRIQSFNYGFMEQNNKPPGLKMVDSSNDLGLNAIQSWCLLRHLPIMFGDLVHPNDQHWYLFILLLQIVSIVFSSVVSLGMTFYLKHLISEHHGLFKHLFPNKRLLPKHHFMVHYPQCIRKIGPLLHTWCMRYEAKHNIFKKQLKSFKNITKTLAKKHQCQMAYLWQSLDPNELKMGPGKMVSLNEMEVGVEVAEKFEVPVRTKVLKVKWAKRNGAVFRPGLAVCVRTDNEMPVFHVIQNVVIKDEQVLLVTVALKTHCLDEHTHAFKVSHTTEAPFVLDVQTLLYHKIFDILTSYDCNSDLFIVPYCFM
ncbi:hypothetical protein AALO_G00178160 [Alosa alosa]|uniref:C2H2-type domain-containing protein n=1 Tax=Alosa alosa TaxID=278164 RepID=A0AAV6GD44_9TELE|nr:uncharacterized protein LOC125305377 [Alosa alosa]KAG5271297.1 hypothetical protein AALO_G00178160 [Alosa alosa]